MLVELMRDADFETVRVAAAKEILDRAYGKSTQPITADVNHGIQYEVILDFIQRREPAHPLTIEDEQEPKCMNGSQH